MKKGKTEIGPKCTLGLPKSRYQGVAKGDHYRFFNEMQGTMNLEYSSFEASPSSQLFLNMRGHVTAGISLLGPHQDQKLTDQEMEGSVRIDRRER